MLPYDGPREAVPPLDHLSRRSIAGSTPHVVKVGPHVSNASRTGELNAALPDFLKS